MIRKKEERMNKLAVSLMISYVLLISIGVALSIGVYIWLKDYANINEKIDCKDGTSLVVERYSIEYQPDDNRTLNLFIKNNGLFNVSGFFITIGNDTKRIPQKPAWVYAGAAQVYPGFYDFVPPLTPGDKIGVEFRLDDLDRVEIMQIQPFIYNKDEVEKIYCEQSLIKQNILITPNLIPRLVSWWKFDGNVFDSEDGNDGVIGGNPVYEDGELNQGLKFDGDDYVEISDLGLSGIEEVTFSVWAKVKQGYDCSLTATIMSDGSSSENGFTIVNDVGICDMIRFKGNSGTTTEGVSYSGIDAYNWNHFTGVSNLTGLFLYINGTLVSSNTGTFTRIDISNGYEIGHAKNHASKFFNGIIDEVVIYDRALTSWEVLQLYNSYNITE